MSSPPVVIEDPLHGDNTAEHFSSLVHTYARAAISGAVPKFIAPEMAEGQADPLGKSTLRTSRHIIKGSDENTSYLGFNEYYAMRVLDRLGVARVARARLSDDGRVLIVDRFDVDESGVPLYGVEDACGLPGLPPHEMYAPSTERVLGATRAYPRCATNPPALSVDGRKTWAPGTTLERFFNARPGIAPKQYREMVEQLCDSAVEVGKA